MGSDETRGRSTDLGATVEGPGPGKVGPSTVKGDVHEAGGDPTDPPDLDATVGPGPRAFAAPVVGLAAFTGPPRRSTPPRSQLETRATADPTTGPRAPGEPAVPHRLGRYMVISRLGAGGMGVVYKAYDPGLDRKVALKLLLGPASEQARGRLLREAQAMARLSHPNVVPVFDVDMVDDQVFVAMDYIDGQTLSGWLEARHPWQEVVDVFVQAGKGLAAAHAVGLIHRDFKPDNVLLSRDRASGELRAQVADFGLARRDGDAGEAPRADPEVRRLGRDSQLERGLTRVGAVIGTPAYMSPEQHAGAQVDARTDQFSFCVALHEALYGERPFTGDSIEALAAAASEPRRRTPPAGSSVPGWLHRLCLRGLSPDRAARYPDMDALLAEIADRRAQGRNRWLLAGSVVALTGAVTAALLTRAPVTSPGEQRCAGGPARLAGVWDSKLAARAERAFQATGVAYSGDAWQVARGQLERYGDAWLTMYRDSCEATERGEQSAAMMDLRMACLGDALHELGALARLFAGADKQVVRQAVDASLALPSLEACADASALLAGDAAPPADRAEQVEAVRSLLAEARTLRSAGKHKDAVKRASEAMEAAEGVAHPPLGAEARLLLGQAQASAGELEPALATLTAATAAALATGNDPRLFTGLVEVLELIGYDLGRHKEAAAWGELARGALLRIGNKPRDEIRLLATQAVVDLGAVRYAEAEAGLLRELQLCEGRFGGDSPRLRGPLNSLGAVYVRTGRYSEAERMFKRSAALAEAALGPNHPNVAEPLANLAFAHERQARYDEALALLRRALVIYERTAGPDSQRAGLLRHNIAYMLRFLGDLPGARVEAERSLEILITKLGAEHPAVGTARCIRGDIALAEGDLVRARAEHQAADDLRLKSLGAEHPDRAFALIGLAKVSLAEGRPAEAIGPLELAQKLWAGTTPDPGDLGELRWHLGRALWATGERARAHERVQEARADLVKAGANSQRLLRELERWLAEHPP